MLYKRSCSEKFRNVHRTTPVLESEPNAANVFNKIFINFASLSYLREGSLKFILLCSENSNSRLSKTHHIGTSQLICRANQQTSFFMMATLAFNELIESFFTFFHFMLIWKFKSNEKYPRTICSVKYLSVQNHQQKHQKNV